MPPSGYVAITIAIPDLQEIDNLRKEKESRQDVIRTAIAALKIIREKDSNLGQINGGIT